MEQKKCHLVILCHGLWGVSDHFNYIEHQLKNSAALSLKSSEDLVVYTTKTNEKFKTYDGIDLCGTRVAEEILLETQRLSLSGYNVAKISMVGYSLGGLIGRYALGVLYVKKYFDSVEPVNFTSFCSPHVGVLTPGNTISIKIFNWLVPILLGNSGRQLFFKDAVYKKNSTSNMPLLTLMSMPDTVFYKALSSFKNIALYSNIRSDIRTSWWCSGISFVNPFEILDKNPRVKIDKNGYINFENGSKFGLKFVDNYEPIILDVDKPITFTGLIDYSTETAGKGGMAQMVAEDLPDDNAAATDQTTAPFQSSSYVNFFQRKFKWVTMLFRFGVYLPMWMTWFVLHNWIQVFNSTIRVLKESSKVTEFFELIDSADSVARDSALASSISRPPLAKRLSESCGLELNKFENELHDQGDEFIESVFEAITSTNNIHESIFDTADKSGPLTLTTTINKLGQYEIDSSTSSPRESLSPAPTSSSSSLFEQTYSSATEFSPAQEKQEYRQILTPFKLDLAESQKEIIRNLNELPWRKFPLYITKTNATHAAAIVRHEDPAFEEGKVVVKHFVEEVFHV